MPALLIINYGDILDQEQLDAYRVTAGQILLDEFGGTPRVSTDETLNMGEGYGAGSNTVAIEYESVEAARAAYDSEAYQDILGQRLAATRSGFAIVVPTRV